MKKLLLLLFPLYAFGQGVTPDPTIKSNTNILIRNATTVTRANHAMINDELTDSKLSRVENNAANGTNSYSTSISWVNAYTKGLTIPVFFQNANTGSSTITVNSLGSRNIQINGTPIGVGDIIANLPYTLVYDGSNFQLFGSRTSSPSFSATSPLNYGSGIVSFPSWPPFNAVGQLTNDGAGLLSWVSTTPLSFDPPLNLTGSTVSLPLADGISSGYINSTDYNSFNSRLKPDGSIPLTADWDVGGYQLKNAKNPTSAQDLVTKHYADSISSGAVTFQTLSDGPGIFTGKTLNYNRVNAGETALEYRTPSQVLSDIGGQASLVSGTNIKTVNSNSLVGSGNVSVGTLTSVATSSPITGGTITTTGTIGISDAAADGSTKGASTFTASDFNSSSGNISIDYTNGQAASGSVNGFVTTGSQTFAGTKTFSSTISGSINGNAATVTTNANLTGDVTSVGNTTTIATGAVTDDKASLLVKPAVAVVSVSNLTLSGEQTIDGQLTSGSLVLLTAQTSGTENGPWVSASGAWSRPTWYVNGSTTQAPRFLTTFVRLGTTYQGTTWRMTTASVTIGTTATTWVETPLVLNSTNLSGTVPVANGGTASSSAGIGAFNNITGYTASGATGTTSTNLVFSTSPTLVTPTLGVASLTSETITGTGGNGFTELQTQSSNPSAPSGGTRIFSNSNSKFSWRGSANTYVKTFDGAAATADRVYSLPDATGTVTLEDNTATLTNKTISGSSNTLTVLAASQLSGVAPIANGGTNNGSLTTTQGTVYYGDGSKIVGLATGTSGQALITGGASANPHWGNTGAYTIQFTSGSSSPADATNYFVGSVARALSNGEGAGGRIILQRGGTINIAQIMFVATSTLGTNESFTIYLRVNATSNYAIATVSNTNNQRDFSNTSLGVSVSAGDDIQIEITTPTWATNPTGVFVTGYVIVDP